MFSPYSGTSSLARVSAGRGSWCTIDLYIYSAVRRTLVDTSMMQYV